MENNLLQVLTQYWGYTSFRAFQEEAIRSILDDRDTLTILPTGGGKSVCFQLPTLVTEGTAIIISPLISLMKDQVDYLKEMGLAAESLNSSLTAKTRYEVIEKIREGKVKLLYLSPERLMFEETRDLLQSIKLSFFVIDEAHCISHWGHNFRQEYRQLGVIKQEFKNIAIHAFTATATEQVQKDIVAQLKLDSPHIYIGNVDRPNLTYRVKQRSGNILSLIVDVIKKHPDEPGIIYCIKRSDVDDISQRLNDLGYKSLPYHAGLPDRERKRNQDEFSAENVPIIVATIAFGMGVDRSNIRYVIHAAMPKSIEHYQQETGRAGRDGLPADCYLFYSGQDYRIWEYMLGDSPDRDVLLAKLRAMYNFCTRPECRHRYLVHYFSQDYENKNCSACDYCMGEIAMVDDPLITGQKILSCVARVNEKFGAGHIADILKGSNTEAVRRWGHDALSTFALMKDETHSTLNYMIEQLIGQDYLKREGEFSTLAITELGRSLLRGEVVPIIAKPITPIKKKEVEKKYKLKNSLEWEGIDKALFKELREKRAELARLKSVPAYIVFSDKTLKDMALQKPVTLAQFSGVFGVGAVKQKTYGDTFIRLIKDYLSRSGAI
ncbi:MAG: ATP-dependent DNA helicase RecQ [Elusimicrobia bacterium RIFOXYB2_FULL_48_7]|nr:MAG: ATP-dependent DNA helicase RecQ [Elusimicrobia bacterium RIFOXYB2_FULL_48_7]